MEKTINGVVCKVVAAEWEVYFDMAMTMLEEIMAHNAHRAGSQAGFFFDDVQRVP